MAEPRQASKLLREGSQIGQSPAVSVLASVTSANAQQPPLASKALLPDQLQPDLLVGICNASKLASRNAAAAWPARGSILICTVAKLQEALQFGQPDSGWHHGQSSPCTEALFLYASVALPIPLWPTQVDAASISTFFHVSRHVELTPFCYHHCI